jgi:hypothetical protein
MCGSTRLFNHVTKTLLELTSMHQADCNADDKLRGLLPQDRFFRFSFDITILLYATVAASDSKQPVERHASDLQIAMGSNSFPV